MRKYIAIAIVGLVSVFALHADQPEWSQVPEILSRIVPPAFPERDFDITRFGAVAGGQTDCTAAIAKAIDACTAAGGGRVVVPAGEFLTGPIHLQSNVNLHLETNAVLEFSTDPNAYLPAVFTRFEGTECYNLFAADLRVRPEKRRRDRAMARWTARPTRSNWLAWSKKRRKNARS